MTTNGASGNGSMTNGAYPNGAGILMDLCLPITDQSLYEELNGYQEGEDREKFALSALKIGVTALQQAQGRIDAERVRQEGERLIEKMSDSLSKHQNNVIEQVGNCLKGYFDPTSGHFNERVQRLVGQDGELERVIRSQIEGTDSNLSQTLDAYVGQDSRLMQILNPESNGGLIIQLTKSTETMLTAQRERILSEFSKDNKDSAINRLIVELTNNHGEVGKALGERIDKVTGEFSLDRDDSALSRLVGQVERAQRQISSEFDLNEEGSALARMRKELLDTIEIQRKSNEEFQRNVIEKLTEMTARKQEAEKGTRHGLVFEDDVFSFVNKRSQNARDVAERTSNTTGLIRNNKKGDMVVELGPEAAAAGAKIVIEAKENASYTLQDARRELDVARQNRGAEIGLFVFSKRTATKFTPSGELDAFNRYGNDIVIVWDAKDPASDVFFDAGLSVAKALCLRSKSHSKEIGADFKAIEKAIREIERQAGGLEEITTLTTTIKNNSDKILERARIMGDGLTRQISTLDEKVTALRESVGSIGNES